ncbi:MAG: hypothetical protein ACFFDN_26140 [Candidatus Hodarchaeota archaeon]
MTDEYEVSEIKLRSVPEVWKDIPDELHSKKYIPLGGNAIEFLRFLDSWEQYEALANDITTYAQEIIEVRFEEAIEVAKAYAEGKLERPNETITYYGFPPVLTIRADLQRLATKMIYGPSTDITFMGLDDYTREVVHVMSIHYEEGLPADWWYITEDEKDILSRRHMKLGYQLREIPQRIKDWGECAKRLRDIMLDYRNERTPQWAHSAYSIAVFYTTFTEAYELSNWESIARIYDGVTAKSVYGLEEPGMGYEPWPPILNTMFGLTRGEFCEKIAGMIINNLFYVNHIEKEILDSLKKHNWEIWDVINKRLSWGFVHQGGIPLPRQTIESTPPKYDPVTKKWVTLVNEYPPGPRFNYKELDLTVEECLEGILFDIDQNFDREVRREDIISMGHGLHTKYLRPKDWQEQKKAKKVKKIKKRKIKRIKKAVS